LDTHVSAVGPASFLQALDEGIAPDLPFRIVRSQVAREHAYASHSLALLRPCREWRPRRRAAKKRDEGAALDHSITSSATTSNLSGTVRPSILALSALLTHSNFLTCP